MISFLTFFRTLGFFDLWINRGFSFASPEAFPVKVYVILSFCIMSPAGLRFSWERNDLPDIFFQRKLVLSALYIWLRELLFPAITFISSSLKDEIASLSALLTSPCNRTFLKLNLTLKSQNSLKFTYFGRHALRSNYHLVHYSNLQMRILLYIIWLWCQVVYPFVSGLLSRHWAECSIDQLMDYECETHLIWYLEKGFMFFFIFSSFFRIVFCNISESLTDVAIFAIDLPGSFCSRIRFFISRFIFSSC